MGATLPKQLAARRIGNGHHAGVGNALLHRHGIELIAQFVAAADHLDAELLHGLFLHHAGGDKHAAPLAPEGRHQRAIVKLAHDMGQHAVPRQPALELLAHRGLGAGNQQWLAIQAGREIRILVENEKISENDATMLCKDIIKKISLGDIIKAKIVEVENEDGYT